MYATLWQCKALLSAKLFIMIIIIISLIHDAMAAEVAVE